MKVAVLGRNANATTNMQGNYFGTAPFLVSPREGIAKHAAVSYADGNDIGKAVGYVAAVDAVVLVVGLTSEGSSKEEGPRDEAEGHDRTSLLLPGNQDDLIKQVAAAGKKKGIPVIVVVIGGGPLDMSATKANPDVGAIMWAGYPGQSGGDSIAESVFGMQNKFGKLTLTWYPERFATEVKITDMHMRPGPNNPGRTYRFYTGTPVFKFGEGLSYTEFGHELAAPSTVAARYFEEGSDMTLHTLTKMTATTLAVTTTNTGVSTRMRLCDPM